VIRNLGGKNNPQSIMVNGSYQKASDHSTYTGGTQLSDFISLNVSYSYSIIPTNTTVAVAGNVYENNAAGIKSRYWGPTLSVSRAFFEKTLKGSLASSYNETSASNIQTSPVWSNRLGLNYVPKPKGEGAGGHTFSIGLNVLKRFKGTEQQPGFTEYTATANYTYTF
jgi:hypothetical protein